MRKNDLISFFRNLGASLAHVQWCERRTPSVKTGGAVYSIIGSVFFYRLVCQSVVRWLCKLFDKALVVALARAALAMCLQNALAY